MAAATEIWLPLPHGAVEGLPNSLTYHYQDGEEEYRADPADRASYVVPCTRHQRIAVRPLGHMKRPRPVRKLSSDAVRPVPATPRLLARIRDRDARGAYGAGTAATAPATPVSSRDLPEHVRARGPAVRQRGVRQGLVRPAALMVGHGGPESTRAHRAAPTERAAPRGPMHGPAAGDHDPAGACSAARVRNGAVLVNAAPGGAARTGVPPTVPCSPPGPGSTPLRRVPAAMIEPCAGGTFLAVLPGAGRPSRERLKRWAADEELEHAVDVA